MKALLVLLLLGGAAAYFFTDFGNGRVAGPLSPPLGVTYREPAIGRGIVADIANHSDKTLYGVRLKIVNHYDGHSTTANVTSVLKPGEDKEVGWMELDNWTLEAGEEISIYADGYAAPFVTSCSGQRK